MEIEKAIKAVRKEIAFYKHEKKELDEWEPMDAQDSYTSGYSEAAVKVGQQLNGLETALGILRAQAKAEKGCVGCKYQKRAGFNYESCIRCKRHWRDRYEAKAGEG